MQRYLCENFGTFLTCLKTRLRPIFTRCFPQLFYCCMLSAGAVTFDNLYSRSRSVGEMYVAYD